MKHLKLFENFSDEIIPNASLLLEKNIPLNKNLWQSCVTWAKSRYDVWPSAYACGAAAKRYKSKGGKWRKNKKS